MSLKSLVRTLLHARQPMILWWGPDLVQHYNDAMLDSMRDKHLKGMGKPGREAWKQAWLTVGHELQKIVDEGVAIWNEDIYVPVDRNDRMEDAWWTYSYSPAFDDDGQRAGILIICTETTTGLRALGVVADKFADDPGYPEGCVALGVLEAHHERAQPGRGPKRARYAHHRPRARARAHRAFGGG